MNIEDSNQSEKIFRHNISTLKGKPTRIKLYPVVIDYIIVPKEIMKANKNVTISGDILFFNKIPFFKTISHNIKLTAINRISNRALKHLISSMWTVK